MSLKARLWGAETFSVCGSLFLIDRAHLGMWRHLPGPFDFCDPLWSARSFESGCDLLRTIRTDGVLGLALRLLLQNLGIYGRVRLGLEPLAYLGQSQPKGMAEVKLAGGDDN